MEPVDFVRNIVGPFIQNYWPLLLILGFLNMVTGGKR